MIKCPGAARLVLILLLLWPYFLLLFTLYLVQVNKCSSEAPESYCLVCVDVVVVFGVVVVIVVVVNVVAVALIVVTDHIILN